MPHFLLQSKDNGTIPVHLKKNPNCKQNVDNLKTVDPLKYMQGTANCLC